MTLTFNREQWVDVPGFPGYQVSDAGRVRSIVRRHNSHPHVMKLTVNAVGYLVVNIRRDKRPTMFAVHQLVMLCFRGPCPDGQEVCHRDGIRTNAALDNLRYGTRASNEADKWTHGTQARHRLGNPKCNRRPNP